MSFLNRFSEESYKQAVPQVETSEVKQFISENNSSEIKLSDITKKNNSVENITIEEMIENPEVLSPGNPISDSLKGTDNIQANEQEYGMNSANSKGVENEIVDIESFLPIGWNQDSNSIDSTNIGTPTIESVVHSGIEPSKLPFDVQKILAGEILHFSEEEQKEELGTMNDEEYGEFIEGVRKYYNKLEEIDNETLEKINTLLDEYETARLTVENETGLGLEISTREQSIQNVTLEKINQIESNADLSLLEQVGIKKETFDNMSLEEKIEFVKTNDSEIQEQIKQLEAREKELDAAVAAILKDGKITTYQQLKETIDAAKTLQLKLQQEIQDCNDKRNSAYYDYLPYREDYNNFNSEKTYTQEELDAVEQDSNMVDHYLDNVDILSRKGSFQNPDLIKKEYSYDVYKEKHLDTTPLDYLRMIHEINPNRGYIINGIDNVEELEKLLRLEQYDSDLAKKYNYLYQKEGNNSANDYLKACEYQINDYEGQLAAKEFLDLLNESNGDSNLQNSLLNSLGISMEGLLDGTITFTEGLGYAKESVLTLLNKNFENRVRSPEEYKILYILNALLGKKEKEKNGLITRNTNGEEISSSPIIDFTKDYNGIFKNSNYEISQGIGNMLPSILISAISRPLGAFTLGTSAGGMAYHNAMVEGKTAIESFFYELFSGTSEAVSEALFGALPFLSDTNVTSLSTFLKSMVKEGTEEYLEGAMDYLYRAMFMKEPLPDILDEDGWYDILVNDLGKQGFYGAITAGILNSPRLATSIAIKHPYLQFVKDHNISEEIQQKAMDAIKNSSPEAANLSNEELLYNYAEDLKALMLLQQAAENISSQQKSNEEILLDGGSIPFQKQNGEIIDFDLQKFFKYRSLLQNLVWEKANWWDLEYQREYLKSQKSISDYKNQIEELKAKMKKDPANTREYKSMIEEYREKIRTENDMYSKNKRNNRRVYAIVYDITTDKFYEGMNGWILYDNKEPIQQVKDLLPPETLHREFIKGNCAEIDAINKALQDGVDLKNILMYVISFDGALNEKDGLDRNAVLKKIWEDKASCTNCTYSLNGNIAFNYSGWTYPSGKDPKSIDWTK